MGSKMIGMAHSNSYSEQVAAAVQSAITAAGTSVNKVSTGTGIPQATLSRRINGFTPFTVSELESIAHHLGIPVEQLSAPMRAAS